MPSPAGERYLPPEIAARRDRRSKRKRLGVFLNFLFALFAAGLGIGGYFAYESYMDQHVSLEDLELGNSSSRDAGQALFSKPAADGAEPLGERQLKWCLRQELRLEALEQEASTNLELSRHNNLRLEVERLCDYALADQQALASAREFVSARRDEYYQEAFDLQLLFLGGSDDGEWTRSQLVTDIQTMLDSLGYDVGIIDGLYGTQTRVAIKSFERATGQPETGLATAEILRSLRVAASERIN